MKEVFILTGLSSKARKDGDTNITVTLQTQVSPDYAGTLLLKLSHYAHQQVIASIESQQEELPIS